MTYNREKNPSSHKILANHATQLLFFHLIANIENVFVFIPRMSLK